MNQEEAGKMGKIREKINREIDDIEKGVADQDVGDVLIGLRFRDDKSHWHVPKNDELAKVMVREAMALYNIGEQEKSDGEFRGTERVKMTLHMPLGDRLVFSAALRDFKKAFPEARVGLEIQGGKELWTYNPNVDLTLTEFDVKIKPGCQEATNKSNSRDWHYVHAFRESIEGQLGVRIPMGPIRPDVWLSEEEYHAKPPVEGPYWLVTAGINPSWTYKTYPFERWQEVVRSAKDITFVQIGIGGKIGYAVKEGGNEVKRTYEAPILQGDNVINMVGQTDGANLRKLLTLFLHCEGSLGLVSSQMHLAAAFGKPCVVVAGAREPVWFTRYFGHQYVTSEGCLPCSIDKACWKCNENCQHPVRLGDGSEIPGCIDVIKPGHVLDRLNYYYDGGRLARGKKSTVFFENVNKSNKTLEKNGKNVYINSNFIPHPDPLPGGEGTRKEELCFRGLRQRMKDNIPENILKKINFLASFSSAGGGEQSAKKIVQVLREAGWTVHLYSWDKVHQDHRDILIKGDKEHFLLNWRRRYDDTFENESCSTSPFVEEDIPLLFYGNDQIYDFVKEDIGKKIVDNCSQLIVCINWAVGELPRCEWLRDTKKLKAIIFHNSEKINDWKKKEIEGFENVQLIPFIGAIDLEKFLEYPVPRREKDGPLVIVKHGVADDRKYVTTKSQGKGEKVHLWQKHCIKDLDTKFYERLLNSKLKRYNLQFRFMQAPAELVNHFKDHPQFKFYRWNEMPVNQFLSQGHIYVDRCSDDWRHNFPRTAAENLAAGLPIIAENRDGWRDRIINGDTGFLTVHYNDYEDKIDLLARKEDYRYEMGLAAREYARVNLDPKRWVNLLGELLK